MVNRHELMRSLTAVVPPSVRTVLRRYISFAGYDQFLAAERNAYAREPDVFDAPGSPCTLGIIRELYHYHRSYVAACRELGVSYRILDLTGPDWVDVVRRSGCDAFLVWPTIVSPAWKEMFDDRLRILAEDLGKTVFPTIRETWLYENKRRIHEWLTAHDLPQPRTWVFYHRDAAMDFVRTAELPIVLKTSLGTTAHGVWILRRRGDAERLVRSAFARGLLPARSYPHDWQRGSVYLQEYVANAHEWRMVRIGDSFFGYRKEKQEHADFHSGSGLWSWLDPPRPLLDMLRKVTDAGGFRSMDVDILMTESGRLLVTELQTVFGAAHPADQLRIDGKPGRYLYEESADRWRFEEGDFCRNECANGRVEYLVTKVLGRELSSPCDRS